MRKKVWTANEEFGNLRFILLFIILWYSGLIKGMLSSGFQPFLIVFLAAGVVPVYTAALQVRRVLFYRRKRAAAIAWGDCVPGRIVGYMARKQPYYSQSGRGGRIQYRNYYYYQVVIVEPSTGVENTLQSDGYSRPVHQKLSSDRVKVYRDKSGWGCYLEELQFKKHRSDPGILSAEPREFEDTLAGSGNFLQTLICIVMVLVILSNIFGV